MNIDDRYFRNMPPEVLGEFGERLVEKCFIASLVRFVPLHSIETGRAPVVEHTDHSVLPDMLVTEGTKNTILDVKTKMRSVMYHKLNEERHGIDRDLWNEYQRSGFHMKAHAGLVIVEMFRKAFDNWSGSVLLGAFAKIRSPREACGHERGNMVYWPRANFEALWQFSPREMYAIARGELTPESKRKQICEYLKIETETTQGMLF